MLDMGQPVKIDDLARSMIHLSGLEVLDETNPDGDIAIEYIGLRGGEKLFEELLIRESSTTTIHKSIIKNHENHISYEKLKEQLDVLQDIIELKDKEKMYDVLSMLVEDYSKQKEAERNSKTHESISKQESIRQLQ